MPKRLIRAHNFDGAVRMPPGPQVPSAVPRIAKAPLLNGAGRRKLRLLRGGYNQFVAGPRKAGRGFSGGSRLIDRISNPTGYHVGLTPEQRRRLMGGRKVRVQPQPVALQGGRNIAALHLGPASQIHPDRYFGPGIIRR